MRKIPLVPVAVAMIAGIAVGHHAAALTPALWLGLMVTTLVAAGLLRRWRRIMESRLFLPLLALLFFALGGTMCRLSDPRYDSRHWTALLRTAPPAEQKTSDLTSRPHFLALQLTSTPEPRERSWRTRAEVQALDGMPCHGETNLFLRKDSLAASLRYGDKILIHTYIDPENRPLYTSSDHCLVTARDSTSLRARSESVRMRLLRRMQEGPLEQRHRGVAEALTLGWRGDMDKSLHQQFRDAGILHLLCVSGLHIGLLALIVNALLFWVGKDRRGRIVRGSLQLAAVWAFALLSGLAPATLRASFMFSMLILNRMAGRRTDSLNLLALAAIVMLTAKPMLLFDLGWQLSFASVAAILVSRPAIGLFRNFAWSAAVVSTAATLATLPIALGTFHQVQPYFLIANVVIIPLAVLLLALALLYMAVPCTLTATLASPAFAACDWLTSGIAGLPHAVVDGLDPNPLTLTLIAMAIILIMITINMALSRYQKTKTSTPC